jgi:hypothetical protein
MTADEFRHLLLKHMDVFKKTLATEDGQWAIKGFIDIYKNIYTISGDTKIVSKVIELVLFPVIAEFAAAEGFRMVLSEHQNHYPDITFVAKDESMFAVDIKSTYRETPALCNGFTLGCFTGYFRERTSKKNITFPYQSYVAHFVLGVIYSRAEEAADERERYPLDKLLEITSVAHDFQFLLQEKWRIASARPGSGNTKNIGSVENINALINGEGPFAKHGEKVFDEYWMNYLTKDMGRAIDSPVPYRNFDGYWKWKEKK